MKRKYFAGLLVPLLLLYGCDNSTSDKSDGEPDLHLGLLGEKGEQQRNDDQCEHTVCDVPVNIYRSCLEQVVAGDECLNQHRDPRRGSDDFLRCSHPARLLV